MSKPCRSLPSDCRDRAGAHCRVSSMTEGFGCFRASPGLSVPRGADAAQKRRCCPRPSGRAGTSPCPRGGFSRGFFGRALSTPPFPQHQRLGWATLLLGCPSPASPLPTPPLPGSPRAAPAPPQRGCDASGAAPRGRGSEIGLGRCRRAAGAAEQRGHARPRPRRAPQPGRRRPRRQGQAHAPRQGHPGR